MNSTRRLIGLMSGTSCDGVDAALIEVLGRGLNMKVRYVDHCSTPYAEPLRNELLAVMAPAKTRTEYIARLNMTVGRVFAACAKELLSKTGLKAQDITAIGSHGQTICHLPDERAGEPAATFQIGESAVIAAQTGITVVADFRASDVAAEGNGAPLVPWTDYVLFHSDQTTRCIQNIGGIANVTYIPAGGQPEDVVAFDTGPGCMVIDQLVRRLSKKKRQFDLDGSLAAQGEPDVDNVIKMMLLPYFSLPPPKSAGREQFGRSFVRGMSKMLAGRGLTPYDKIATVTLLTARSIAEAYKSHLKIGSDPVEVVMCGGGAKNETLLSMLKNELPEVRFVSIDRFGIPRIAKECVSFAMLAAACLDGICANLPQVTGASRPAVLGKIVRM